MNIQKKCYARQGIALIAAMIFIVVFATISIGFLSLSSANTQISVKHRTGNNAMNAALSALDCAKYIAYKASAVNPISTGYNYVTTTEANTMWSRLCTQLQNANLGGQTVPAASSFTDSRGSGQKITTPDIPCQNSGGTFQICYYRYNNDPNVWIQIAGKDGTVTRNLKMALLITKDATVLDYAIAGRGRFWLTGDTTIHGGVYSAYGYKSDGTLQSMSPFNMTADSTVEGSFNTILTKAEIDTAGYYHFETLDADGNPLYTSTDQLQGQYDGVNYGVGKALDGTTVLAPGLNINDYNTTLYKNAIPTTTILASVAAGSSVIQNCTLSKSSASTVTEYFPHASGSYTTRTSGSLTLKRYKYESKTFKNVTVSAGENALFKNCTFEDVLYINCSTSGPTYTNSSTFNNVRFENCTFNGAIITNVPKALNANWWMANCLYFTGTAAFQNNSSMQEATILAPHFNINLGNTNPNQNDNNVLTGAIIGGIVDIRGNAQIYGTIISMADTASYTSGYVANIGATLADGGSETTAAGDVGIIEITPDSGKLLPSGITTPIVLKLQTQSYQECL